MNTEELQKLLSDGSVEVIEDGKKVDNPRIDPGPMGFLLQAAQLGQMVRIRKYFDDRTSKGLIQTWGMDSNNPLTITDALKEIKVDFPAQSFSLINDGLNTVYVWVNTMERPKVTVKSGAKFEPNYETHKIAYIYLQCASGQSTNVRIVAKD